MRWWTTTVLVALAAWIGTGLVGIGLGELYRRLWSRPFDWRRFWRNAAIGLPLWVLVVWAIRTNH